MKIFLGILGFTITLFLGLAALIWFRPGVIINEKNILWGLQYAPEDLKINWRDLKIDFENPHWYEKNISLKSQDLCVIYGEMLDVCAPVVNLQVYISFEGWSFSLKEVQQVQLHTSHIHIRLPESTAETAEPKDSSLLPNLALPAFSEIFPQQLSLALVKNFDIQANGISLWLKKEDVPFTGYVSLQKQDSPKEIEEHLQALLKVLINQGEDLKTDTQLVIDLNHQELKISGPAKVITPKASLNIPLELRWKERLDLSSKPLIALKDLQLHPQVKALWSREQIQLTIAEVENKNLLRGTEIGVKNCQADTALSKDKGQPQRLEIHCLLTARPLKKIKYLDSVDTELTIFVETVAFDQAQGETVSMTGEVKLAGETALLKGDIGATGKISLKLKPQFEIAAIHSDVKWDLTLPEFALWKDLTERTAFAIPAPLHVLTGPITLIGGARIEDKNSPVTATAELKTLLKSEKQKFLTTTRAEAKTLAAVFAPQGLQVKVESELEEIVLEAPPLRFEAPPQFLPDGRFVVSRSDLNIEKEKPKDKKSTFPILWEAHVKNIKPIYISNQIFPKPLPLAVDIHIDQSLSPSGKASLLEYPFKVFSKAATVKNVDVILHKNSKTPELSGKIFYTNPEVDVEILLLGSTAKPRVEFESDPPLNRQQIISILLFNKSLDELNEEEVSSASNISRAMSNGALGLFSLIFLSSTPIQSVGYDPTTQSYTARLRIDDSTTLSIGSDFDERRNFAVRRRLGGPWSVRTELRQTEDRPDVVLTLLEWLKRF